MSHSPSRRLLRALFLLPFLLGAPAAPAGAQTPRPGARPLKVFFECHARGCDFREIRTRIDWVSWVRDRKDAQVHVIVTDQETGSGGRSYTLDFIGVGTLAGQDDRLTYASLGTDVQDETVQGLTRVLAVGLARFSVLEGSPAQLEVVANGAEEPTDRLVTADEVVDPWNFWVYRVDVNAHFDGETSRTNKRVGGSIQASRTTVGWKVEMEAGGTWRESVIALTDSTLVDTRRDWHVDGSAVYALAEHWSAGMESRASAATATNQNLALSLSPAVEYSVWPYEESPRRSLRARYTVGVRHFRYAEETLFGYLRETRGFESLVVSLSQRQPWGNVYTNLQGSHYLHDLGKYRLSSGGYLSFRIVRGLSLRVDGRVTWVRDQLYLPAEGVSDEEILLQRRQLASNFDWNFGVGFSFQFGSIYNNVVNNRF